MERRIVIALLKHIENLEVQVDEECGSSRPLKELIRSNAMPEAYYQAKKELGCRRGQPVPEE